MLSVCEFNGRCSQYPRWAQKGRWRSKNGPSAVAPSAANPIGRIWWPPSVQKMILAIPRIGYLGVATKPNDIKWIRVSTYLLEI
jgi:hypothetical protein